MPATLVDLVKVSATSTGTGAIVVGQAVPGYRGVEALQIGETYSCSIQQGSAWEFGRYQLLASPYRLVRTVLGSSNGGAPINLLAGATVAFVALSVDLGHASQPFGFGVPDPAVGAVGEFYYDLAGLTLYGPKTQNGWGSPYPLKGTPGTDGKPGAAGNVAIGRAQLKVNPAASAPTGDVWNLSAGGASGPVIKNAGGALIADPKEAVFIGNFERERDRGELNVKWFGAVGDGVIDEAGNTATGTDDTEALQAAINFAVAQGGGTIKFPDGVYIINGDFQTAGGVNAQLMLPWSPDVGNEALVRFVGTTPPALSGGSNKGAIIMSPRTVVPDNAQIWSIIGCKDPGGSENRSWLSFYFDNITFRVPQNSRTSALDMRFVHQFGAGRYRIDVIGGFGSSGPNGVSLTYPSHPLQYGIIGGLIDLPLWNTLREGLIFGYSRGLFVGELTGADDLCISGCDTAMVFPNQQHPSRFGRVLVLSCVRTIQAVGTHETYMQLLDVEHTPLPSGWPARGYDLDHQTDSGVNAGDLRGEIVWHVHEAPYQFTIRPGVGGNPAADKNIVLRNRAPWQQSSYAGDLLVPNFFNTAALSGMTITREIRPTLIPWHSMVAARPNNGDAVAARSVSNFANIANGPADYRRYQEEFINDGGPDAMRYQVKLYYGGALNTVFGLRQTGLEMFGLKVLGARGASLPADATDLPTALTLVNAIKARMVAHGLVAP